MTSIQISDELYNYAAAQAALSHRSVEEEVAYMVKLTRAARDNPDLPIDFIHELFEALEEVENGETAEFKFGVG